MFDDLQEDALKILIDLASDIKPEYKKDPLVMVLGKKIVTGKFEEAMSLTDALRQQLRDNTSSTRKWLQLRIVLQNLPMDHPIW